MFTYKAFGLILSSELECPELLPCNEPQQVVVRFGNIPDNPKNMTFKGVSFEAAPNYFFLKTLTGLKYLVSNGNEIIIDNHSNIELQTVRTFLYGSILGALLQQRHFLTLHGSCLVKDNKCCILSGETGSGKSTLSAYLVQNGFKLVSDDITAVNMEPDGTVIAYPGIPGIKLWIDSIKKLQLQNLVQGKIRPNVEKFRVDNQNYFHPLKVTPKVMYILSVSNKNEIVVKSIKGIDKLQALTANTYRYNFYRGMGLLKEHFELTTAFSKAMHIKSITRPLHSFDLEALGTAVINDMEEI